MSLAGPLVTPDLSSADRQPLTVRGGPLTAIQLPDGWRAYVARTGEPGYADGEPPIPAVHPAQWRTWLASPLRCLEPADRRDVLKASSTTKVVRVRLAQAGDTLVVVLKHRRSRHFRKRLLSVFRTSRPLRTFRRARALLQHGIATARPLAVLERRRFGLLMDSIFISEYLRDATDLENLLTAGLRDLPADQVRRLKRQLTEALAAYLLQLEAAGFYHRDMKALNVIVQWDPGASEPPRISLVDLDGLKGPWPARSRSWLRMLMRLNVSVDGFKRVSRTDRLRLLKRYLELSRQGESWRAVWKEIAALSERKRNRRTRQQERSFRKYGRY